MREFVEAATTFPAVVWTIATLVCAGFWLFSSVLGIGDGDFDFDTDADLDTHADLSGSVASTLGLAQAPPAVVLTALSLAGWLVAMVSILIIGTGRAVVIGLAVLLFSGVVAVLAAGRFARLAAPLYATNRGLGHRDLVGRVCVVRTGRVDADFGQADVVDPEGSSHVIQVRCPTANDMTAGSQALIVDVDDGLFTVDPDTAGLV